jgi:hypothetical protein
LTCCFGPTVARSVIGMTMMITITVMPLSMTKTSGGGDAAP